jgi:hypothetical protein
MYDHVLQAAQVNEESPWESSLDFMLTHHFRDEDPELREVPLHLDVEPFQA